MPRFHRFLALPFVIGLAACLSPDFPSFGPVVKAQTTNSESENTLCQLLAIPAPTPLSVNRPEEVEPREQRPEEFYHRDKPPPDDAPLEDLFEYWSRWADIYLRHEPTDFVKQRLLDACRSDWKILPRFLPLLPRTDAVAGEVKALFDRSFGDPEFNEGWQANIKVWLLFNTKYLLGDLLALVSKVKDNEKGGYVEQQEALRALARVDWSTAEPLLQNMANGNQQRTRALAITLLYKQAISAKEPGAEEKYRAQLQTIASDRNASALARNFAIDVLSLTEWAGRDDWYLSLFHDETLIELSDGSTGYSPLTTLFTKNFKKWIPVMSKLVESNDLTVRSAAASCLIVFQNHNAREDALRPLLPWLSNPQWAKSRTDHRLRLIQSMGNIDLPESVPGLIWAVEHDNSESGFDRSYAAQSLAKYKDPRAAPALKKALAIEKEEGNRHHIIQGLIASGGLSETDQVDTLEAFAAKLTTAEGREEVERYRSYGDEPLTVALSIGKYLSRIPNVSESLVRAVLARAETLKKENPSVAQSVLNVAHQWQGRLVDLDVIHRIASGSADAATIAGALVRRSKLRESVGPEIQALTAADGAGRGIAPVLLDDTALAQSVLGSDGPIAKIALLACARLTQMPLPVLAVGALMQSKNPLLAQAAESYLLIEDSPQARQLLWGRYPNKAFITGWKSNVRPIEDEYYGAMIRVEGKLRDELFKDDSPLEIFALLTDIESNYRVLRIYPGKAVYTYYENRARYRERVVTKQEVSAFRGFVVTNNLMDLGPQFEYCHHGCEALQFLMITKEKGRRVFSQGPGNWMTVIEAFDLLGRGENGEIHYNLEKDIKGLEVLYTDDKLVVRDVWQRGLDIRILVEREQTEEELDELNKARDAAADDDDQEIQTEVRRTEIRLERARFTWRALEANRAGDIRGEPQGYATVDEGKFIDPDEDSTVEREIQVVSPDMILIARNFDGFWKQVVGQKAVRISGEEGAYARPIVTPDGRWVIVAKTDSDWGRPNYIVRFNLGTGHEFRVNIPPADQLEPMVYVAPLGKVLIRRAADDDQLYRRKSQGPEAPEYYLLDAATGETRLVSGAFDPLRQRGKRFLQPTGKPNEFWAALPDSGKNRTQVGRYNLKDFSFQPLLVIPQIAFESTSMWVDEAGGKLYIVYEGQLLRVPLRSTP